MTIRSHEGRSINPFQWLALRVFQSCSPPGRSRDWQLQGLSTMTTDRTLNTVNRDSIFPDTALVPPPTQRQLPTTACDRSAESPSDQQPKRMAKAARRAQAATRPDAEKSTQNGQPTLPIEEIRGVELSCAACHTVLHFPRAQWISSPECCPNCGTQWMRPPAPDSFLSEDPFAYIFQTILAFRDALQALAAVGPRAQFTLALEMEGSPNRAGAGSPLAGRKKNGGA